MAIVELDQSTTSTTLTSKDIVPAAHRGKRLKRLIAVRQDDPDEPLASCGQFGIYVGEDKVMLHKNDLFDDFSPLVCELDILLVGNTKFILRHIDDAASKVIVIYGEIE